MNENTENNEIKNKDPNEKPVNENGGFLFSSAVKIYDPNTEEVLVQIRGDN